MRPMDFEEYCWAAGITEGALESVHSAFEAKEPLPEYLHDAMLNNYRTYMVVGGMPEAVKAFVESRGSLAGVRSDEAGRVVYLPFYMTMCLGSLAAPPDDLVLGVVAV